MKSELKSVSGSAGLLFPPFRFSNRSRTSPQELLIGVFCLLLLAPILFAQDGGDGRRGGPRGSGGQEGRHGGGERGRDRRGEKKRNPPGVFRTEVPQRDLGILLARPTDSSITVSILSHLEKRLSIAYGTQSQRLDQTTTSTDLSPGKPVDFVLSGLAPNTGYFYRILRDPPGKEGDPSETVHSFHTARKPGTSFSFTVTADSHLDDRTEPEIYRQTMLAIASSTPDFNIDLGDTFMNDKKPDNRPELLRQYFAQRYYFGLFGHSVPSFLVVGNHDGESIRDDDGTADSLEVWSTATRMAFFPNPVPNGFFSGNTVPDPAGVIPGDYYSWTWGDALFIVLDPYRFSERQRGGDDNWKSSLGKAQYQWLKATLEGNRSRFVFVFIHQLVGGVGRPGRGGAVAARLYEWGGKNPDGRDSFAERRPGWDMPIHDLLVKNRVSVVFHGHDHLFAKEDLDGIVYQEVPQPGFGGRFDIGKAEEGSYQAATLIGGAGHLKVTVEPRQATVDFIRTTSEGNPGSNPDGNPAHSYSIQGTSPFWDP